MCSYRRSSLASVSLVLLASMSWAASASADVVVDWNRYALNAIRIGGGNAPRVFSSRSAAIVHVAIFNAVNGIEDRYAAYDPAGTLTSPPAGASKRAAAVQAGYMTLFGLFPAQDAELKAERAVSLEVIKAEEGLVDGDDVMKASVEWGNTVAAHALALRSADKYLTVDAATWTYHSGDGKWQRTQPNPTAAAVAPQLATFKPWVMGTAGDFLATLPGPPPLTSRRFAADLNETRTTGRGYPFPPSPFTTLLPVSSPEQRIALFWQGDTVLYWNRIAGQVSEGDHLSLAQNARLFALLNIAMADAAMACWNAKYHFDFWRPITAITLIDAGWTPYLVVTPAHPEYPSGHSTVSGAAAAVLTRLFGDKTSFSVDSEVLPGVIRSFKRFSDALAEVHNARVWGGIHFRSACQDGSVMGQAVANFVLKNALQPLGHDDDGDDDHGHGGHDHK